MANPFCESITTPVTSLISAILALTMNSYLPRAFCVVAALTLVGTFSPAQSPGSLDTTFDPLVGGFVWATALQPDGTRILGGEFSTSYGPPVHTNIVRLTASGAVDHTFTASTNGPIRCIAVQADGKFIIGGEFTSVNGSAVSTVSGLNYLARLNGDGTLDSSFNTVGFNPISGTTMSGPNHFVRCITIQPDGKILIGGEFTHVNAEPQKSIARLDSTGALDPSFNALGTNGTVFSIALQPDGKIVLGGTFAFVDTRMGSVFPVSNIARINGDGTLDNAFNANITTLGGANNLIDCLALQPDGKILVTGGFDTIQGHSATRLARLNASGTPDTAFNTGGSGPDLNVFSLALQTNGKFLIGGAFMSYNGSAISPATGVNYLTRLNVDGTRDTLFNATTGGVGLGGANQAVASLAIQPDGRPIVAGTFTTMNGVTRHSCARLFNDSATRTVSSPSTVSVTWTRGGSAPELSHVTFEQSVDSGLTWTMLGNGTRTGITSNWSLVGLNLPLTTYQLRARGRFSSGMNNGSSSLIEQIATITVLPPEIDVRGNLVSIVDGDTTPSTTDWTDFGTSNGAFSRTFIVHSTAGPVQLTGTPKIVISGAHASDFTFTNILASSIIQAGNSLPVTITFTPSAVGLRTATVSIANNDANENPYTFDIQATATAVGAQEISVTGNNVLIPDGDTTPTTADFTDFGTATSKTFVVRNTGSSPLTLTGGAFRATISGPHAADFTVSTQPTTTIAATTGTSSFVVTFIPSGPGQRTATVTIPNDDWDENPYTFDIQGTESAYPPEIRVEHPAGIAVNDGSSTPISFGSSVGICTTVAKTFTVKNDGLSDLHIQAPTINGAHAPEFVVSSAPTLLTIPPSSSSTFDVSFTPSNIGARNAALHIVSDDPNESPFDIQLTGFATGLQPSPAATTCVAQVKLVDTSTNAVVVLHNAGDPPIVGQSLPAGDYYVETYGGTTATSSGPASGDEILSAVMQFNLLNASGRSVGADSYTLIGPVQAKAEVIDTAPGGLTKGGSTPGTSQVWTPIMHTGLAKSFCEFGSSDTNASSILRKLFGVQVFHELKTTLASRSFVNGAQLAASSDYRTRVNFHLNTARKFSINATASKPLPGSTQAAALLPASQTTNGNGTTTWLIADAPSGKWVDPPVATTCDFAMTETSLFTKVLDFPTGFADEFTVIAEGATLGTFGPGEPCDFVSLLGHGVSAFRITDINPGADPDSPTAFPIQLEYDTATASFTMTMQDIVDVHPSISITPPASSTPEGSLATLTGTFTDPQGNATVTLAASSGTITQDNAGGAWAWSTTAADGPAANQIVITATDATSNISTASYDLLVTNVAPTAVITAPATGIVGSAVNYTFTAIDIAADDQASGFEWTIDYADGTPVQTLPAGTRLASSPDPHLHQQRHLQHHRQRGG